MKEKNENILRNQVSEGLKRARKKMIAFKKQHNTPLVVSKSGKVVIIPADELELPSD